MNQLHKSASDTPSTAAAVSNVALSKILDMVLDNECAELGAIVKNNGSNAFTNFEVRVLFSKSSPEITIASVAGDYSGPAWPLRRADALVTLGAGLTGKFWMNVQSIYAVRFYAQISTTASTANVDAVAK